MNELELKENKKIKRLTNKTFQFDSKYGEGFYSANYFLKTARIIEKHHPENIVTMQFFQRKDAVLCGIDEVLALIQTFAYKPETLKIEAMNDGDIIHPMEPVLKITGQYQNFGYLEGAIDGILARRTSVTTNCTRIIQAAAGQNIIFMGDREDDPITHPGDGYAAYVAGVRAICTDAMGKWTGLKGMGTMPHALIQMFKGDLIKAANAFIDEFPETNLVVLVDFYNDCITDSLKVARVFKEKLFGVRIDTSAALIDKYFEKNDLNLSDQEKSGVSANLVIALRKALDKEGFNHVKIIVSSGFNVEKVKAFTEKKVPVDSYGIGSSLIKVNIGFTGDCVKINGMNLAKTGREEKFSELLVEVKLEKNGR